MWVGTCFLSVYTFCYKTKLIINGKRSIKGSESSGGSVRLLAPDSGLNPLLALSVSLWAPLKGAAAQGGG